MIERHELKTIRSIEGITHSNFNEKESELVKYNENNAIEVRSDIPLRQFPDYVLEMTEESQQNSSKLSAEYSVSNWYSHFTIKTD